MKLTTQKKTFHFAGVAHKSLTLGVPRMNEILDGTPRLKTPMVTCYFSGPVTLPLAERVAKSLVHFPLKSLVVASYHTDEFAAEIDALEDLVRLAPRPPHSSAWMLRLDKAVMQRSSIHPHAVEIAVKRFSASIECYVSEEAMPTWECKISAVGNGAALAAIGRAIEEHVVVQGGSNAITGASARAARVSTRTADGGVLEEEAHVIETDGSDVRSLLHVEGLDAARCVSNDIVEVIETLGIEIGLAVLRYELKKVLMFDGGYINERHIDVLCHTMCFEGYLRPVSRHGLARQANPSFLTRASFEESMEVLADGGLWNLSEPVGGNVTSSIMFGKICPVGTGNITLVSSSVQKKTNNAGPVFVGKKRRAFVVTDRKRYWDFFQDPLRVWERASTTTSGVDPAGAREGEWWDEEEQDPWAEAPGPYDALPAVPGLFVPPVLRPLGPIVTTTFPLDEDNWLPCFAPTSPTMFTYSKFDPGSPRLVPPDYAPSSPMYDPNKPPDYAPSSPMYDPNKPPESPPYSPPYDPNKPQTHSWASTPV